MNIRKLGLVFCVLGLEVFSSCFVGSNSNNNNNSNQKLVASSDATISTTSTVKGVVLGEDGLGTPVTELNGDLVASSGSATLTTVQAQDITNATSFITLFTPANSEATVRVVHYLNGELSDIPSDADYEDHEPYNGTDALSDGDSFIVRVTSQDTTTVRYYRVVVTVLSNVATLTSATHITVSAGGTTNETITNVRDATSKATFLASLTKVDTNEVWNDTNISDPVLTNDTLVVTSQDATRTVTYTITVNAALNLRDAGPAGGIIFYVNPTYNYATDDWKYLEAAPNDVLSGSAPFWGCAETNIPGVYGVVVGTGKQNTLNILAGCSEVGAAAIATTGDLYSNGYSDWFLPSQAELNKIYVNMRSGLDENSVVYFSGGYGFSDCGDWQDNYWSSTEKDANFAYYQFFEAGHTSGYGINFDAKMNTFRVRPVRSF